MDTKLLAFDIDGTLVSFKTHKIPDSTVEVLRQAHENGVRIIISTGRPINIITNLAQISDIIDGYITTNGAYCFIGSEEVSCNSMCRSDVDAVIDHATALDYPVIIVGEKDIAVYNYKDIVEKIFRDGLGVTNISLDVSAGSVLKGRILQLTPFLTAEQEQSLHLSHSVSARWHPLFTDITDAGADKGKGLLAMADRMNIGISSTMAFGDGGNDIPILRQAGIGVAMGNSKADVQAAADYVTDSVDDNGIRNALLKFGVIK